MVIDLRLISDHRKEEKLSVINMRDRGMSYEDIAKQTGYSRVNMEKWCSVKVRYCPFNILE